jgi:hypothetical protein
MPTVGALGGTGCGGYLGAAGALLLSCFLLHRRWEAIGVLSSRGFPVMMRSLPAARPRPVLQIA